jgi:hypothetical protein
MFESRMALCSRNKRQMLMQSQKVQKRTEQNPLHLSGAQSEPHMLHLSDGGEEESRQRLVH